MLGISRRSAGGDRRSVPVCRARARHATGLPAISSRRPPRGSENRSSILCSRPMSNEHRRPAPSPHDEAARPAARAPTHAERCRTLVAEARSATLCTLAREPSGYPYGSLVTVAVDAQGRPLFLLSELAEHTGNL